MELVLTLISGIAWTLVYIFAIKVGFTQKTYAMPLAALVLNFAWEAIYAINGLSTHTGNVQTWVNLAWCLADVAIIVTFIMYGRREFPDFVKQWMFIAWTVLAFGVGFAVQELFIIEFGNDNAARYSAFLQNLLMSVLFISMYVARKGSRGQSLVIAVAKWLGTLAPTILFGVMEHSTFIIGLGIMCSVFDLIYIGLLAWDRWGRSVPSADQTVRSANVA